MKTSSIVGILGGLITLVVGAAVAAGSLAAGMGGFNPLGAAAGWVGVVLGILIIIAAAMFGKNKSVVWVGLVLSLIALVTGTGYVIGPLLGLIGSALALKK